MKHKIAVNALLLVWALCAARIVYAATFAQEVLAFDYTSLFVGALAGLLGGALRTIFTLANDNRVVFSVLKEARKDLVIAFMAGGLAYLLMLAATSKYPDLITREIRVVVILVAGWTRSAIFTRLGQLIKARIDGEAGKYRAGAPDLVDPPTSAVAPLESKA